MKYLFATQCRHKPRLNSLRIFDNKKDLDDYAFEHMCSNEWWLTCARKAKSGTGFPCYDGIMAFEIDDKSCKTIKKYEDYIWSLMVEKYGKHD